MNGVLKNVLVPIGDDAFTPAATTTPVPVVASKTGLQLAASRSVLKNRVQSISKPRVIFLPKPTVRPAVRAPPPLLRAPTARLQSRPTVQTALPRPDTTLVKDVQQGMRLSEFQQGTKLLLLPSEDKSWITASQASVPVITKSLPVQSMALGNVNAAIQRSSTQVVQQVSNKIGVLMARAAAPTVRPRYLSVPAVSNKAVNRTASAPMSIRFTLPKANTNTIPQSSGIRTSSSLTVNNLMYTTTDIASKTVSLVPSPKPDTVSILQVLPVTTSAPLTNPVASSTASNGSTIMNRTPTLKTMLESGVVGPRKTTSSVAMDSTQLIASSSASNIDTVITAKESEVISIGDQATQLRIDSVFSLHDHEDAFGNEDEENYAALLNDENIKNMKVIEIIPDEDYGITSSSPVATGKMDLGQPTNDDCDMAANNQEQPDNMLLQDNMQGLSAQEAMCQFKCECDAKPNLFEETCAVENKPSPMEQHFIMSGLVKPKEELILPGSDSLQSNTLDSSDTGDNHANIASDDVKMDMISKSESVLSKQYRGSRTGLKIPRYRKVRKIKPPLMDFRAADRMYLERYPYLRHSTITLETLYLCGKISMKVNPRAIRLLKTRPLWLKEKKLHNIRLSPKSGTTSVSSIPKRPIRPKPGDTRPLPRPTSDLPKLKMSPQIRPPVRANVIPEGGARILLKSSGSQAPRLAYARPVSANSLSKNKYFLVKTSTSSYLVPVREDNINFINSLGNAGKTGSGSSVTRSVTRPITSVEGSNTIINQANLMLPKISTPVNPPFSGTTPSLVVYMPPCLGRTSVRPTAMTTKSVTVAHSALSTPVSIKQEPSDSHIGRKRPALPVTINLNSSNLSNHLTDSTKAVAPPSIQTPEESAQDRIKRLKESLKKQNDDIARVRQEREESKKRLQELEND